MTDIFLDYARKATSTAPARLVGCMKTRAEARVRYSELVAALRDCADKRQLNDYLFSVRTETIQYRAELPEMWHGEGDFTGLRKEIECAYCRTDAGLDWPRYEPEPDEEKELGL